MANVGMERPGVLYSAHGSLMTTLPLFPFPAILWGDERVMVLAVREDIATVLRWDGVLTAVGIGNIVAPELARAFGLREGDKA